MNWQRVRTIAWWEYYRRVREKGFILSIIMTPILMIGLSVLPGVLGTEEPESTEVIGVIDQTGEIFAPLKAHIEHEQLLPDGAPAYLLVNYLPLGRNIAAALRTADSEAVAERVEGVIVIAGSVSQPVVTYRSANPNNIRVVNRFQNAIQEVAMSGRLLAAGIDTAAYNRSRIDVAITAVKVSEQGEEGASNFITAIFTAMGGALLLMFVVMSTGQSLVRSLIEEKSNRVMDTLVSCATPSELMWGKLIGLGGLGVTQILAWSLMAIGAIAVVNLPTGTAETLRSLYSVLPLILVYLVVGYIFYTSIFITLGSLVTTEQEAQVVTSYLILFLVAPVTFAVSLVLNPDAQWITLLSFIPLMTPSLMLMRLATTQPPDWQIIATLALLLASTVVMITIGGRIFRTAILLYGKRPSFKEVMRWVREG